MSWEALNRADLIDALRELAALAAARGVRGGRIRLVGGGALLLMHFDRDVTADLDAEIEPSDELLELARGIAHERGWPDDWLNDRVATAGFMPRPGRQIEWTTLYESPSLTIQSAPPDVLLAMKVAAMDGRGSLRDARDTEDLLAICGVQDLAGVLRIVEDYYPGQTVGNDTLNILSQVLASGARRRSAAPPLPDLGQG